MYKKGLLLWICQNGQKNEVELACKRENPNRKDGEFDYGCACYESALKAFESLYNDNHSGASIVFTKNILNRLIDGKPLTPITDDDDEWKDVTSEFPYSEKIKTTYQSKRFHSLFKRVYNDDSIKYNDTDRTVCINKNKNISYHSSFTNRLINEIFPISLPYGGECIKVYEEDFLYDEKNGDFDTVGILYAIKDGEKIEINKFFKEGDNDLVEITKEEYERRKQHSSK